MLNPLKKLLSGKQLIVVLKLSVSLGIIAYILQGIEYDSLMELCRTISPFMVFLVIALSIVRNVIGAIRFKKLSDTVAVIPLHTIIRHYFIASFYNNLLPSVIGGDAARIYMSSKEGLPVAKAVTLITIERLLGLYALILIAFASVYFWDAPVQFSSVIKISFWSANLVLPLIIFINLRSRFAWFNAIIDTLRGLRTRINVLVAAASYSVLFQFISIAVSILIGYALGAEIAFSAYLTFIPLVWLFTMLPISIGGVGLREMSFVYLFGLIGVEKEVALLISLGTYASLIVSSLIGASMILLDNKNKIPSKEV
jgi:glycosyltransferase 2 family protein